MGKKGRERSEGDLARMSQSKQHETESIRISKNVDENIKSIGDYLGNSADLIKRVFRFHKSKQIKVACLFIEGLINKQEIEKAINRLIYWADSIIEELSIPTIVERIESSVLINTAINTTDEMEKVINLILAGETVLFFDGSEECIIISTREWASRSVDEPQTEQVVRGPRDGFIESLRINTALVRRRIRDPSLRIEAMTVGSKSKTDVNIVYLENTAKKI
jgi:spore germination protein KA